MSSKSKKKSKVKNDKIKLKEIAREDIAPTNDAKSTLKNESAKPYSAKRKPEYKVKVLAGLDNQNAEKYETAVAAALSSTGGDYELLCVVPSPDSQKLIAFFKLSK